MRYFLIFDELSEPEGDLYRWDGNVVRMRQSSGEYSDHCDFPCDNETVEELMTSLAGSRGTWKEIDEELA
jgi:hypothetical protein